MAKKKTIIIVGGTQNGPSAAARARQFNEHARIVLVEKGPSISWTQASLKDHLLSEPESIKKTMADQENYFNQRYNIEVRKNTTPQSIDLDSSCLILKSEDRFERIRFDALIYAEEAKSKTLPFSELTGPRAVNFCSIDDVLAIQQAIKQGAKRAVVVGCGFYGIDAAVSLRRMGLDVLVIEKKKRIMPYFSLQFSQAILSKLSEDGISVALDSTITDVKQTTDGGFFLYLASGEEIASDLVVECIGITPQISLLTEAGAAQDGEGLVRVDDHMATSLPNVFACGSAIQVPYAVTQERKWMPQPAILLRTAQIAGYNAAIDDDTERDRLQPFCGTLMVMANDTFFARTGLSEYQARLSVGDENVMATTVFGSAMESMESEQEMCVRLIVNRAQKHIVGGEVYGKVGVARRIDILSVAVSEHWSPQDLINIDMAYLANSGAFYEPLKDVAMRAKMALMENTQVMSAEMLALWLKSDRQFRLVDVGDAPLFLKNTGRVAMHLPLESLRDRIEELVDSDLPIVLCSKSGYRSYLAQQALIQRGLHNVYHLDGGSATFELVASKE